MKREGCPCGSPLCCLVVLFCFCAMNYLAAVFRPAVGYLWHPLEIFLSVRHNKEMSDGTTDPESGQVRNWRRILHECNCMCR